MSVQPSWTQFWVVSPASPGSLFSSSLSSFEAPFPFLLLAALLLHLPLYSKMLLVIQSQASSPPLPPPPSFQGDSSLHVCRLSESAGGAGGGFSQRRQQRHVSIPASSLQVSRQQAADAEDAGKSLCLSLSRSATQAGLLRSGRRPVLLSLSFPSFTLSSLLRLTPFVSGLMRRSFFRP